MATCRVGHHMNALLTVHVGTPTLMLFGQAMTQRQMKK